MADSLTVVQVANHPRFQGRVDYYMSKAAVAVIAEAQVTVGHAARVVYAKTILDGTASAQEYSTAVMTNSTLVAAAVITQADHGITDGDLEFTTNSMFNAMAGVETGA